MDSKVGYLASICSCTARHWDQTSMLTSLPQKEDLSIDASRQHIFTSSMDAKTWKDPLLKWNSAWEEPSFGIGDEDGQGLHEQPQE